MSRTRVKICGITRREDALAAVRAGADAIGLVFYAASPRAVDPVEAARIVACMPPLVTAVGLFVDADRATVEAVCSAVPLDLLQFHGDETAEFCASIGRPWMKAIRVSEQTDIGAEIQRFPGARAVLLDTFVAGVPGGTGARFDWSRIPGGVAAPVVLAGGLTAENVGSAVAAAAPFAVDVSGGVESAPGIKDADLVRKFIAAVYAADQAKTARDS